MAVNRPYYRTCRQFVDGYYSKSGRWQYIVHPQFAQSPEHYVRAFLLLLKDLRDLFDYIEPADINRQCYSYRIHSLLLRACVEVEANCKAILRENGYQRCKQRRKNNKEPKEHWSIEDYRKIEKTHFLSGYKVKTPNWSGEMAIRTPFQAWEGGAPLPWYEAYNSAKHDRHAQFQAATFGHLIDAVCGLLVLLSAQFETNDFSPGSTLLAVSKPNDGMKSGIGDYFRVGFPADWPMELRYDFDWQELANEANPFQKIDYASIT